DRRTRIQPEMRVGAGGARAGRERIGIHAVVHHVTFLRIAAEPLEMGLTNLLGDEEDSVEEAVAEAYRQSLTRRNRRVWRVVLGPNARASTAEARREDHQLAGLVATVVKMDDAARIAT